jgi:hypothetical protein
MVKVIFLQRWVHRSRPSKIQHLVFTYGIWVRFAKIPLRRLTLSLHFLKYSLFKRGYSPFIAINALQSAQIFGQRFLGAAAVGRFENLLSNSAPHVSDRLSLIFRYRRQPRFLFRVTICTKQLRELFD